MNDSLDLLAKACGLNDPHRERLRLEFGFTCAARVEHLLDEPNVKECLHAFGAYLAGPPDAEVLAKLAADAARLATQHQGSKSIDGCGHAAVSATYALAKAVGGNALQAASYAAYAAVYAQGGHGAVADRDSFQPEFEWQLACLAKLAGACPATQAAA